MQSSRMHTVRLLTVSRSIWGGVSLEGCTSRKGGVCCPKGGGGVSQHAMGQTPLTSRGQNDRQV